MAGNRSGMTTTVAHASQLARRPINPEARRGHDRAGYGLVHADLCRENILDHHGQARPIDFDDASWGLYALDLAIAADDIPGELHPVLLRGYQTVCPLPPGYHEHQAALLSARRLYLAIWHLANGLPDEDHLGQLAASRGPAGERMLREMAAWLPNRSRRGDAAVAEAELVEEESVQVCCLLDGLVE
jgi:Ser/Thr protein kinase RdoA (MazF antagonist)